MGSLAPEGGLVPVEDMRGDDLQDTHLLNEMLEEATDFIRGFAWSGAIRGRWFGLGVGGVVAVFLFELAPARPDVDDRLWVVVGDLPPAYLVLDDAPTPREALARYVEEMSRWVEAASAGAPVDHLIPTNAPPTRENADLLASRLAFIRENFLDG
jgi:hypothetical protein